MAKGDKWIQKAIKRRGRLRRLAQREGAITKKGTISVAWLREKAKSKNKSIAAAARLALRLREMRR